MNFKLIILGLFMVGLSFLFPIGSASEPTGTYKIFKEFCSLDIVQYLAYFFLFVTFIFAQVSFKKRGLN